MPNIWFTSDTHFNHARIIEMGQRKFASVEEMNETMIERWNSVVRRGDRVYHLGDFALGKPAAAAPIAGRLTGDIFLIRGNHDKVADHRDVRGRFVWIKDYFGLKVGQQKIYLLHYAMMTWNCMHHGSWHLHGHSHGSLRETYLARRLDVGVDPWNFYPVNYDQVAFALASKVFVPVDHHIS